MVYRKLGNADLKLSAICFGAWAAGHLFERYAAIWCRFKR
jgi:aryl-alcohol dehydrogenase-like predicted oxidoreductase